MACTNPLDLRYPKYQKLRCGIRVKFYYYIEKKDADVASDIARKQARYLERQGYSYGTMYPGTISAPAPEGQYAGLWVVVIP